MKKRLLSVAMALCFSLALFPSAVFAANIENPSTTMPYSGNSMGSIRPSAFLKAGIPQPNILAESAVVVPNTSKFQSNEEFKPYDPWYPKKDQYGNYFRHIPELKGRLTFSANNKNQLIGTLYAPGVSKTKGWQDATKRWGQYDSGLCFAASSSNLISWYLNEYIKLHPENKNDYELEVETVFDHFRNGWEPSLGGNQKEALSWYFTGGFPSGNTEPFGTNLTGREKGGYLRYKILNNTSDRWADVSWQWKPTEIFSVYGGYDDDEFPFIEDVGGMTNGGAFSTLEGFSEQIIRQLHYGACTISIVTDSGFGGSGHAITLWGVDYDVDTGLVTAIHVTDSDDNQSKGLFTVQVQRGDSNGGVRMVSYPYYPPFGSSQKFTRIRDSIVLYSPEVVKTSREPDVPGEITSDKYPIDENKHITGIQPNATLEGIQADLIGQNIKVFDAQGNPVAADAPLGTGYVLTMGKDASDPNKLTVVVSGDVNGDAAVNQKDVSILQQALTKKVTLEGVFQKAAVCKSGSKTGPKFKDMIAVKQFVLQIIDTL